LLSACKFTDALGSIYLFCLRCNYNMSVTLQLQLCDYAEKMNLRIIISTYYIARIASKRSFDFCQYTHCLLLFYNVRMTIVRDIFLIHLIKYTDLMLHKTCSSLARRSACRKNDTTRRRSSLEPIRMTLRSKYRLQYLLKNDSSLISRTESAVCFVRSKFA